MERHFEGKKHAALYKRYRPVTHNLIVQKVMNYVKEKHPGPLKLAADVGCGSGQNTLGFAPYFEKVVGTDISPNMVAEAAAFPSLPHNVSFQVSPAESLPFPDSSIDMVTAAQCFHWFNQEKFNQEMQRVLVPNGVVAIIGHDMEYLVDPVSEAKSNEFNDIHVEFIRHLKSKYRSAISSFLDRYSSVPFPYDDVVREINVSCDCPITLTDFVGVLETYSIYQQLCEEQPETGAAALEKFKRDMVKALGFEWGTPLEDIPVTMRLDNFYLFGRKQSKS